MLSSMVSMPNPYNLPQVNHKDGNKINNSFTNLEWVTDSENKDHRKNLLNELRKESIAVLTLAYGYAKNFAETGVDITEKWVTTEQQTQVLEQIYKRAYEEGLIRGREIGEKTKESIKRIQESRIDDDYDYFDDDDRQDRISRAIRNQAHGNVVQPTNAQRHGKGKKKRHHR